ncbi:retron Eco8 family effector endonuclease [Paenibacillus sp. KACC 21273]|uniref:retron Eco8 family effector endonuclease n=1 Tax=Paenibacillus sp. KACC 21273 TaxID=3025665 RepID=UPI0023657B65|nr:retron Eco8 family effector endonuclease [Paenibacillus sp. KACC 21273]WDF51897.1 retron Eco8 family effector endonuclease [Paenibacillus sp. KACC 21273]
MSIEKLSFKNVRSLKNVEINLNDIVCMIGENGVGKSNVIRGIKYFYDSLTEMNFDPLIFDKNNPYNDYIEISIVYNVDRLLKITNRNLENQVLFGVTSFFEKISNSMEKFVDKDNNLVVTLKQYKNNKQYWNIPYDLRVFLKNNFPIYFIQARNIELKDWNNLWEIIGDMSKFKADDTINFENEILITLQKIYGDKFVRDFKDLKNIFFENEINFQDFNPKQQFSHIYQLQMGGKLFKYKEKSLSYFSDGMSSYNYLKILMTIIGKMAKAKLKEPCIIIDEPEIGLHPNYIDDLVDCFIENSKAVRIIISSHSSRIVKNILSKSNNTMYHISLKKKYTIIKKMNEFVDKRERNIISEKEASFYFSKGILFVEGATELELFKNPYLIDLFPILKKFEIYSYDSDNVKLKLTNPSEKNTSIPYLLLLDMDKIMSFNTGEQMFYVRGDNYNPLLNNKIKEKENFLYGKKRFESLNLRKRIKGISTKVKFNPNIQWGYIKDDYYQLLISLIQKFCLNYNVFPVTTTIEGSIVTLENSMLFQDWILSQTSRDDLNKVYNSDNALYITQMSRILVSGKYDTLNFPDNDKIQRNNFSEDVKEVYSIIENNKKKKTDGWVTDYLEYFFENIINNKKSEIDKISIFKFYFKELSVIINKLEQLLNK